VRFGVRVVDGDGGVRERGKCGRSESDDAVFIRESEGGGMNSWSFVMHFLCDEMRTRDAEQEGEWKRECEETFLFHETILVNFYRWKSAILTDFARSSRNVDADGGVL
jgi:hypothetical protein